jgi:uncharacterized protein (UPF0218 family)/phosphopantetheine adenylyltransferase
MERSSVCLVGGTFDRFHLGHEALLLGCLASSEKVEVWLVSDLMAQIKDRAVRRWDLRALDIYDWAAEHGLSERLTIHSLVDRVGPAETRPDATAIGSTPETRGACDTINEVRAEAGLSPLTIVEVSHILASDGTPISSTRIRAGEIDREGQRWLGPSEMGYDQRMPDILDDELKQPFGTLHEGPEEDPSVAMAAALAEIPEKSQKLIAVGDVCVQTLVDMAVTPDIGLVDGMTKREPWAPAADLDRSGFPNLLTCSNPPGLLTADLKNTLQRALAADEATLVVVDGEEDLAPIIIHLLAPLGCAVVYGQPGKGVVLRFTSRETKENCRRLLDVFTREA